MRGNILRERERRGNAAAAASTIRDGAVVCVAKWKKKEKKSRGGRRERQRSFLYFTQTSCSPSSFFLSFFFRPLSPSHMSLSTFSVSGSTVGRQAGFCFLPPFLSITYGRRRTSSGEQETTPGLNPSLEGKGRGRIPVPKVRRNNKPTRPHSNLLSRRGRKGGRPAGLSLSLPDGRGASSSARKQASER